MQRIVDRMLDRPGSDVPCRRAFAAQATDCASMSTTGCPRDAHPAKDEAGYALGSETIPGAGVTVAKLAKSG
jgi:hypothetical protein